MKKLTEWFVEFTWICIGPFLCLCFWVTIALIVSLIVKGFCQ